MKIHAAAVLAAVFLVAGCGESKDQGAPEATEVGAAEALSVLFDDQFERNLELNPLNATFIGDYRYNDRLANSNGPEYRAASEAMDQEFLQRLLAIEREQLGEQDRLSYDIFKINRELSLESNQFPSHLQPINQFYAITNSFVQLGSGSSAHPFKTVKDYEDFLSRADDFAVIIDQIISNMKLGMQEGVTQPRILMEKLVPQVASQIIDDPRESAFYMPVTNMPEDFGADDRERLTAAFEDKISNTIIPAYQRLNNFLGDEYIAAARETVGLYAQPNGEAWYAYMVRLRTTTDMTPDETHQIGLDDVARIHVEIRDVMATVGFAVSLKYLS